MINPVAMILASKLMLDHLGETEMASRVLSGVETVVAEGKFRTRDMGGDTKTMEMAKAITDNM